MKFLYCEPISCDTSKATRASKLQRECGADVTDMSSVVQDGYQLKLKVVSNFFLD